MAALLIANVQADQPMTEFVKPAPLLSQLRQAASSIIAEYQRLEAENVAAGGEEGAIVLTEVDENIYELLGVLRTIFSEGLKEMPTGLFVTAKASLLSVLNEITLRHDMLELSNLPIDVDPIYATDQKHIEMAWFIMALNDLALPQYVDIIRQNTNLAKQYYDESSSMILDEDKANKLIDIIHELENVYFQLDFQSYANFCKLQQSPVLKSTSFASINNSLSKLSVGEDGNEQETPQSLSQEVEKNSKEIPLLKPSSGETESIKHSRAKINSIPTRGSPLKMTINSDEALNDPEREESTETSPTLSSQLGSESHDAFSSETTLTTLEGEEILPSESSLTSDLGFFGFPVPPVASLLQRHSILTSAAHMIGLHPSNGQRSMGAIPGDFEAISRGDERERTRLLCLGTSIELQICPIKGLDFQHFKCFDCQAIIGIADYPPAKLCEVSGMYYCPDCHQDTETYSPALIVRNWDFRLVRVSCKTYKILASQCSSEVIDVEAINPDLFVYVSELQRAKDLRRDLCRYTQAMSTCDHPHKEAILKRIWPREHLIETIGLYSIDDLVQLKDGSLLPHLQILARSIKNHVNEVCQYCKLRLIND